MITAKFQIILLLSIGFTLISNAQEQPKVFQIEGIAIAGYDPVAFFTLGEPTKGVKEINYLWEGAEWRFSSEIHKNLFTENPEKYAPKFGGYCAWGMREGYKAETQPKNAWTIYEDNLYLNYNKGTSKGWLEEKDRNIEIAENNWSQMSHK